MFGASRLQRRLKAVKPLPRCRTRRPPAMPILRVASKLLITNQPIAAPHEIHADHAAGGLDRANDLIFMRHEPTLFTTFR